MIIAVIIFAVANTNILSKKTKSVQTPNGYLSGMQQAGGPPQIFADQKAPPGSGGAARRITTGPPGFLTLVASLLITSLGKFCENRLFQKNSKVYYQQKANIMCNYSTKNNEKSAKQFKKRALKINNW